MIFEGADHLKEIRSCLREIGEVQASLSNDTHEQEKYRLFDARHAIEEHAEALARERDKAMSGFHEAEGR